MSKTSVNPFEVEELFCASFGISDEERSKEDFDLEEECRTRLSMEFEDLCTAVGFLLPCTPTIIGALSNNLYHVFGVNGIAHIKMEAQ